MSDDLASTSVTTSRSPYAASSFTTARMASPALRCRALSRVTLPADASARASSRSTRITAHEGHSEQALDRVRSVT